jgi:hypothetical protein
MGIDVRTYRKLRDLLSAKERRRFYLLFGMMIVSGVVEMITISAMFPFPRDRRAAEIVETNATLAALYAFLGFSDVKSFLVFAGIAVFVIVFFGLLFATLTQYAIYRFAAMRGATIGGVSCRATCASPTPGSSTSTARRWAPRSSRR